MATTLSRPTPGGGHDRGGVPGPAGTIRPSSARAEHLCMSLPGVQAQGSRTVTSAVHGLLREETAAPVRSSSPSPASAAEPDQVRREWITKESL